MGAPTDLEARAREMRDRMDDLQRERQRQFRVLIGAVVLAFLCVGGVTVWAVKTLSSALEQEQRP